ncbi:uncharacterized protein LOC132718600 [Ruditapes philippinarum]|uniref:uncharacterized protein LOC132718600 n=1 Tax=Ruditapes philippinarum TaxID=129788 RepID=UPI00295BA01F|nr:uncharacterized protein LOC132718600 [Ruditapes philippinarum]
MSAYSLFKMDDQKPELDDFPATRDLEAYADRLWQQRVKTERESEESDEETGSYSPTRENYYYDTFYAGDADSFRVLEYPPLKRTIEDPLSPSSTSPSIAVPAKRTRGRPYKEACVKITCLSRKNRLGKL